jgi:hypothetical protein
LTTEDLQEIIGRFNEPVLADKASFGIIEGEGRDHENFIRANREGLILFACQLLKVAGRAEGLLRENKPRVPLIMSGAWTEHDSMIVDHIRLITGKPVPEEPTENKPTFADRVLPVGCALLLLLLLVATLVGLGTMFDWMVG